MERGSFALLLLAARSVRQHFSAIHFVPSLRADMRAQAPERKTCQHSGGSLILVQQIGHAMPRKPWAKPTRRGTTCVEAAVVLPVFLLFLFFILEFGHAQMVNNMLDTACRSAARYGSTAGVSTTDARQEAFNVLAPIVQPQAVTLVVKDASAVDQGGTIPSTMAGAQLLSDIELANAAPRQPFLVRAEVRYRDVAPIVLPFFGNVVLTGQSITRHE